MFRENNKRKKRERRKLKAILRINSSRMNQMIIKRKFNKCFKNINII